MEYDWAGALRRLEGDTTPHVDYWSLMLRCEICGDNHPTDHCQFNYNPVWQNQRNFSWYNNEVPTYPPLPDYHYYPPQAYEFPQDPQLSVEDQWKPDYKEMLRQIEHEVALQRLDEMIQDGKEMLKRVQAQEARLINNLSIIPQETLPDDTEENSWDLNEQKVEVVEDKDEHMWDPIENEEIQSHISEEMVKHEDKHEQIWEHIESLETTEKIPSQHEVVSLYETAQKLDRMILPFQVKHSTRPPDALLLHSIAPRWKEVAWTLKSKYFYLPPQLWSERLKGNAHNSVPTRTSKATVKPP